MDKNIAPKIVELISESIFQLFKDIILGGEITAVVGLESAGSNPRNFITQRWNDSQSISSEEYTTFQVRRLRVHEVRISSLNIIRRKHRKSSGTKQQLEGTKEYTSRTPQSSRIGGMESFAKIKVTVIWVDDTISTGESLRLGAKTLLEDYNMEVRAAYYLVDRSADRKNLVVISFLPSYYLT